MKKLMNSNGKSPTSTELAQPLDVMAKAATGGHDVNVSKRSVLRMVSGGLSLLLAAQMFVACQPKTSDRAESDPATKSAPVLGGAGTGTGDTAGGDGIENKVFEAFATDVTSLPEWTEYIGPIDQHLHSLNPNLDESNAGQLAKFARHKTWLIAPVTLEQIEKKNLGVAFIRDPIQQLAMQDNKSVWIDKTMYRDPKVADRDRAFLLMHETVVSIYLLKFMAPKELCMVMASDISHCDDFIQIPSFNKYEPKRPLVEEDYRRIRHVTDWLMNKAISAKSLDELMTELIRNEFDSRLFNLKRMNRNTGSSNSFKQGDNKKIDLYHQFAVLGNSQLLGRIPQTCARIPLDDVATVCEVKTSFIEGTRESDLLTLSFSLNIKGKVQRYVLNRVVGHDESVFMFRGQRLLFNGDTAWFYTVGDAMPVGESLSAGQDYYEVNVGWNDSADTVVDIQLVPYRITKATLLGAESKLGYVGTKYDLEFAAPADNESKEIMFSSPEDLAGAENFVGYNHPGNLQNSKFVINPKLAPAK